MSKLDLNLWLTVKCFMHKSVVKFSTGWMLYVKHAFA